MQRQIVYIACPYTHEDPLVVKERIKTFCKVAGEYQAAGYTVVSALFNQLLLDNGVDIPSSWEYWRDTSETLLSTANFMVVIKMDGWEKSSGVQGEITFAIDHQILRIYKEV